LKCGELFREGAFNERVEFSHERGGLGNGTVKIASLRFKALKSLTKLAMLNRNARPGSIERSDLSAQPLKRTHLLRVSGLSRSFGSQSFGTPVIEKRRRLRARNRILCRTLLTRDLFELAFWSTLSSGRTQLIWEALGDSRICCEPPPECHKVARQLFNQALVLKLKALCVTLKRSKRLIKIRFALAKRALPLVVSRALALNRLLVLSKSLDQRLALSNRELGSI